MRTANEVTKDEVKQAVLLTVTVAEIIREAGEVPSGAIYTSLLGKVTLDGYERMIEHLVTANLVKRMPGHILKWVGPTLGKEDTCSR